MSEIITVPEAQQRDIRMVTTEIRTLQQQAQRMVLEYAIEIGRRLTEAKSMLPHGQWGDWLKNEVEFSKSTANNFMKIFDEYGDRQISIFGATANSQTLGNLTYSKALLLLAVPAEEREDFAEENNVESLSTREVEQLVREKKEAEQRAAEAKQRAADFEEQLKAAKRSSAEADKLRTELLSVQAKEAKARKDKKAAEAKYKQLKDNPTIPPETLEKLKSEAEAAAGEQFKTEAEKLKEQLAAAEKKEKTAEERAEALRKQLATASPEATQFKMLFDAVQDDFNKMHGLLMKIEAQDAERAGTMKKAIIALLDAMRKRVEGA